MKKKMNKFYYFFFCLVFLVSLPISHAKEIVEPDRQSARQLGKTDFDRMADHEIRENIQSLKTLMIKLYKRNPSELKKSTSEDPEKMVNWVFNGNHNWNFEAINNAQGTDAIYLTFSEDYKGDKVLPFIVGIYTMLIKAHGGKKEFYLFDSVDPQMLYNASRNIETAVWKLSNAKDSSGKSFLLANEINEKESNLSIYPNPTSGKFALKFDEVQETILVTLKSITGQLIISERNKNTSLISLEIEAAKGIYILEISNDFGNSSIIKLVKE